MSRRRTRRSGKSAASPAPRAKRKRNPRQPPAHAGRRGSAPQKSRPLSFWERHRVAIIADTLVVTLIGAVILTVLMIGIRLVEAFFQPNIPTAVAERLLSPIEERGSHPRLAPDQLADALPATVSEPEAVRRAIQDAARAVGVDAAYLTAVAARESAFDPGARAEGTTAAGLYQFTADTWLRVVKVFGARYGLAKDARQIAIDHGGEVSMPNAAARSALLQRRNDPRLSALMAAELGRDNKARLARMLGREVTPAETYIAHFLGVSQAARLIDAARAAPHVTGAQLLPAAAENNSGVFGPAGQAASVAAIVAKIDAYFDGQATQPGH